MNNLKELTHEQHKNAERSLFVKKLLKKEITPYQYYVYLCNQFLMYTTLETHATDALQELKINRRCRFRETHNKCSKKLKSKRRRAYLFRYVLWVAGRGRNEDREAVDEVLVQHAHGKPSARHAHSLHQTCA